LSNSITEGKGRELPPNEDGEILRVATPASIDLRIEVIAASTFKEAGQGEEMRARSSIESRTDLRLAAINEAMRADPARGESARLADQETARRWADLDAVDFGRIRSDARRENALESFAGHVRASPEYAEEIKKRSPVLADAARDINARRDAEQADRSRQSAQAQRNGELAAASKTRESLLDAASMATLANLRAKQTASLVQQLASAPETSTKELREAQQALKAPPLDGRVTAPNDPDIAAIAKRAIKRPIADEELSQALLARFVVSHEKRNLLDRGTTEFTYRAGQLQGNVAFVDAGKTLQTALNDKETIRAMVEVATAKNWKEVTLTGTDDFKRAAWLEARLSGLEVRGYEARDADKQLLAELQQRDRSANSMSVAQSAWAVDAPPRTDEQQPKRKHIDGDALTSSEQTALVNSRAFLTSKDLGEKFTNEALRELESRLRGERVYTGELVDHGRAAYKFEKGNDLSYFAVLKTRTGEQVVWGKGLEDAMVDRKPGEQIVLQNIGRKDVIVQERVRDAQGQVVDVRPKDAQLNQWKAEPLSQYMARSQPGQQERAAGLRPVMQVYDNKAPVRKSPNKQALRTEPSRQVSAEPPSKRDRQPGRDR
jgi:hypothetical protein